MEILPTETSVSVSSHGVHRRKGSTVSPIQQNAIDSYSISDSPCLSFPLLSDLLPAAFSIKITMVFHIEGVAIVTGAGLFTSCPIPALPFQSLMRSLGRKWHW